MQNKVVRNVIDDIPTHEDLFQGKGHERTAISLANAIKSFDSDDRAIGLDGPWGSGKSSVVEIAARHLEADKNNKKVEYFFFTFDIWKSQGTGFRRSFLEHFVAWAKIKFPRKHSQLQNIEEDIRGKRREVATNNQPILGLFGIIVLFLLPLLPFYYIWAKSVIDGIKKTEDSGLWDYLISWPAILFYVFTVGAVGSAIKRMSDHEKSRAERAPKLGFKAALSSVLLISSKQHQDHKSIQRIREVDPNDYEFHTTLRNILRAVQTDNEKVVVVLDNIDRLPRAEILEYWAVVRSIFSGSHQIGKVARNETITAIVPYDRTHIEESNGGSSDVIVATDGQLTRLSERELFSKTFDEIISVSPPVLSNAREFFTKKLEEALPGQVSKDHAFRTYRIFVELLRIEGGLTTPRQVVSFVNDVSGLYALHEGQFPLPTVAAYLAHQDLLSRTPSVLNEETKLNSKVVDLASDPDLAKHLSAMVFNVAPDLAFELLLDNELIGAIVADSHEELERLSRSPGFELRADEVLEASSDEWRSTGDFGAAVRNFAKVLPTYEKAAKPRIIDALVKGFNEIETLSTNSAEYHPFLFLFDLVEEKDRPKLVGEYLRKGFRGTISLEEAEYDNGRKFAEFLGTSRKKLEELNLADHFKDELSKQSPNSAADFLYGLAIDIKDNGLSFGDLGRVEISLPKEGTYFVDIALEDPVSALVVLKQFGLKDMLSDDDWIAIASACLQKCCEEGTAQEDIARLLDVTCFARTKLPKAKRNEASLSDVLAEGEFFRNLGDGTSEDSSKAIALAVFLCSEDALGMQVAPPTKKQPNGQRTKDVSEEFNQFNEIITGNVGLSDSQAEIVADRAKAAHRIVDIWTKYGNENRDHPTVQAVVKAAYLIGNLPNISLYGLSLYNDYFSDLLGDEGFIGVLDRFEPSVTKVAISKTELKNISVGFLTAVHRAQGGNWKAFTDQVRCLLQSISKSQWQEHLAAYDHNAQLLGEIVATSGCSMESSKFRDPMVQTMLDVLSGETTPPAPNGAFDMLMKAIDINFHAEIWRRLREKIKGVGPESLENAVRFFPNVLTDMISKGDRILAAEKDAVIRHILCPALESDNGFVLEVFVQIGHRRISDFKKHSHKSTTTMLEGIMKSYSSSSAGDEFTKQVVEAVEGKRRARSILETILGGDDEKV